MASAPNRAVVIAVLAACGASAQHPADAPGVRIASARYAERHGKPGTHLVMRFAFAPEGTNGTALVRRFLDAAQARGARYVSKLSLVFQLFHDGKPVQCVSTVIVDDGSQPREPTAPEPEPVEADGEPAYTTAIAPWRPPRVVADVVDRDLACKKVAHQVEVEVPVVADRFAAEQPRYLAPGGGTKQQQQVVWSDRCTLVPARRRVERYAHYVVAKFVPPEWERIAREFSDWKLVEDAPICHQIALPAGTELVQRIEADLHHIGRPGQVRKADIFVEGAMPESVISTEGGGGSEGL